ncbi:MAG: Bifunctional protein GlmU [Nitrospira sp.]|nr:Bifunctional protein GlmU [Nitrospira sp.]
MRAIILAAGRGSRLGLLTSQRPKCLAEIRGVSLLARQIGALREAGINEIAVVTGYRNDMLAPFGLREFHNAEWAMTNMVYSLLHASPWLVTGDCIVSYGDIFYRKSAVSSLMETRADVALTYDPDWLSLWSMRADNPLTDAETFRLRPDGTISEIGGKPGSVSEVEGQYMGLLKLTPAGWIQILRVAQVMGLNFHDISMTGMLQQLIVNQLLRVRGVEYKDGWGEVDTETDLALYETSGPEWL